jgi:hypothetical protein
MDGDSAQREERSTQPRDLTHRASVCDHRKEYSDSGDQDPVAPRHERAQQSDGRKRPDKRQGRTGQREYDVGWRRSSGLLITQGSRK